MIDVTLHVEDRSAAGFGNRVQILITIAKVTMTNGDAIKIATEDLADLHRGVAV